MRIKLSLLILLAAVISVAVLSCKAKKGAGSANVRTLSMKAPGSYMLSLGNRSMMEATSFTTKELAGIDKIKIMSQGKEVKNVSVKFKLKITHDDAVTGSAENDGAELSSQVIGLLKNAVAGDKINFESVRVAAPGAEPLAYPPMSFAVK